MILLRFSSNSSLASKYGKISYHKRSPAERHALQRNQREKKNKCTAEKWQQFDYFGAGFYLSPDFIYLYNPLEFLCSLSLPFIFLVGLYALTSTLQMFSWRYQLVVLFIYIFNFGCFSIRLQCLHWHLSLTETEDRKEREGKRVFWLSFALPWKCVRNNASTKTEHDGQGDEEGRVNEIRLIFTESAIHEKSHKLTVNCVQILYFEDLCVFLNSTFSDFVSSPLTSQAFRMDLYIISWHMRDQ